MVSIGYDSAPLYISEVQILQSTLRDVMKVQNAHLRPCHMSYLHAAAASTPNAGQWTNPGEPITEQPLTADSAHWPEMPSISPEGLGGAAVSSSGSAARAET